MRKTALFVHADDVGDPDGGILVWEGFTTQLFRDLQLPQPYYTSVLQRLRKMSCIRQLSRGGGNAPSRWELTDDPTLEAFQAAEGRRRQGTTRFGVLEQRIGDLNERVAAVEAQLRLSGLRPPDSERKVG